MKIRLILFRQRRQSRADIVHCKATIPKIRSKYFPGKKLRGYSPNFYIHVCVSDLYFPLIGLPILL